MGKQLDRGRVYEAGMIEVFHDGVTIRMTLEEWEVLKAKKRSTPKHDNQKKKVPSPDTEREGNSE